MNIESRNCVQCGRAYDPDTLGVMYCECGGLIVAQQTDCLALAPEPQEPFTSRGGFSDRVFVKVQRAQPSEEE